MGQQEIYDFVKREGITTTADIERNLGINKKKAATILKRMTKFDEVIVDDSSKPYKYMIPKVQTNV